MEKVGFFLVRRGYEIFLLAGYVFCALVANVFIAMVVSYVYHPFYRFLTIVSPTENLFMLTMATGFFGYIGRKSNEVLTLTVCVLAYVFIVNGVSHYPLVFILLGYLYWVLGFWPAMLPRFFPHLTRLHQHIKPSSSAATAEVFD